MVSGLWEPPLGALFAAVEGFASKLPAYSQQVTERLIDNTVDSDSNLDCTGVRDGKVMRDKNGQCLCPLACSDGSDLHRYRALDAGDERSAEDSRALNFAKARRVAQELGNYSAEFREHYVRSAANLFLRSVGDVVALLNIYFTDDPVWDGSCKTLKPSFRLPFESPHDEPRERRERASWRTGSPACSCVLFLYPICSGCIQR